MKEQELLKQLDEVELLLRDARLNVAELNQKLIDAETVLIGHKLKRDRLLEALKQERNASYQPEPDHREADNARFAAALPELLKKIR